MKTYILKTVDDLQNLPSHRRDACLDELKLLFAFNDLVQWSENPVPIKLIEWTDDGDKTVAVHDPDGTPIFTLRVTP